jgi:hypothetical protein
MRRSLFLTIYIYFGITSGFASNTELIKSQYKDRSFYTYVQIQVDVPDSIMTAVVQDFVYQTKYDLDGLYEWALKDLKLRNEKNDLIVFNFKSTTYDKKNDLIKGIGDVEVPRIITFPDIEVDSKMKMIHEKNGSTRVNLDVLYSDAFLKETTAVFRFIPNKTTGYSMTLETKIKFGWFFNIFITTPSYRNIMEWRFLRLMQNINLEAERRHKLARAKSLTK